MIKTITVITSGASDDGIRRKYFELVTNTIEVRYCEIISLMVALAILTTQVIFPIETVYECVAEARFSSGVS